MAKRDSDHSVTLFFFPPKDPDRSPALLAAGKRTNRAVHGPGEYLQSTEYHVHGGSIRLMRFVNIIPYLRYKAGQLSISTTALVPVC